MRKKLTDMFDFSATLNAAIVAFNVAFATHHVHTDGPWYALVIHVGFAVWSIGFGGWSVASRLRLAESVERIRGFRAAADMKQRHEAETEASHAVHGAIGEAAQRALAAGQHAKVQVVIDSWRERQDAQLVEVLRELEQLTRPVGEA